ncbi:MAG: 37S ribosomal protein S22 [Trichoglossum hirsutum]|nr:MAG: 37S ribosomal protein S22 [Trichoglossum hirsutum]
MEEMARYARRAFGDSLPEEFLTAEEYAIYERLYGPPLRHSTAEDTGPPPGRDEAVSKNVLLRENVDGELEEVHHHHHNRGTARVESGTANLGVLGAVNVEARSSQETKALMRLQQDMLRALKASPVEEEDPEYEPEESEEGEEDEEGDGYEDVDEPDVYTSAESIRTHPHTLAGRSRTSPTTLNLPQATFLAPIESLLANVVPKHYAEAAENIFGGKGLPYSPFSPASKKHLPQKPIALAASQSRMSDMEGNIYLSCIMPGVYAAVMSALVEVRKRLGGGWLSELLNKEGGPRFLDAGAGGAGIIAWREVLRAEWERMREEHERKGLESLPKEVPLGRATAVTGSDALRYRASRFIENTTFIPRLPDHVHAFRSAAQGDQDTATLRKQFDVIIAPHTLWPISEDYRRKMHVQTLWSLLNPDGGVLILIEKGLPRGFEAVAGARKMLLSNHISSPDSTEDATELPQTGSESSSTPKETGMIIAPCTNHTRCPMYLTPGLSSGRKDFCHFKQRYIRPPLLQRIMNAGSRNHEDIRFSYLAVRRGRDERATNSITQGQAATEAAFSGHHAKPGDEGYQTINPLSLPRSILPPIKRHKHVTLDVCTPEGQIERWIVPRSFGKQAYRDASKSSWGDLWPLGAKTRIPRKIKVGKGESVTRKGKRVFEVEVGDEGMEGVRELVKGGEVRKGRRDGRKARKVRPPREIMGDEF